MRGACIARIVINILLCSSEAEGNHLQVDERNRSMVAAVTCLKHEGFREEREWRVIHLPHMRPSPLMESSPETVGGIPQTVYKIPLDEKKSDELADLSFVRLFDRMIIG